jgi:hypothetical protein
MSSAMSFSVEKPATQHWVGCLVSMASPSSSNLSAERLFLQNSGYHLEINYTGPKSALFFHVLWQLGTTHSVQFIGAAKMPPFIR